MDVNAGTAAGRRTLGLLGLCALCCFAAHASTHVRRGTAHDVLWACTMSNAVVGLGLLWEAARGPHRSDGDGAAVGAVAAAVAILWLCVGNVTWALDLALGGEFFPTSLLTHWGGLLCAAIAVRRLGWPRHAWMYATGGFVALQLVSRQLTPPSANVNVAHAIYPVWAGVYSSYATFWLSSFVQTAGAYYVLDRLARWGVRRTLTVSTNSEMQNT